MGDICMTALHKRKIDRNKPAVLHDTRRVIGTVCAGKKKGFKF